MHLNIQILINFIANLGHLNLLQINYVCFLVIMCIILLTFSKKRKFSKNQLLYENQGRCVKCQKSFKHRKSFKHQMQGRSKAVARQAVAQGANFQGAHKVAKKNYFRHKNYGQITKPNSLRYGYILPRIILHLVQLVALAFSKFNSLGSSYQ